MIMLHHTINFHLVFLMASPATQESNTQRPKTPMTALFNFLNIHDVTHIYAPLIPSGLPLV